MRYFFGIDDTDVLGQHPGTGRLARDLAAYLEQRGMGRMVGVVRHQLLVDPRIPYTSHNSPACVILETSGQDSAPALFDVAAGYIAQRAASGSDPGVCLGRAETVVAEVVRFGCRAGEEVLAKAEARDLADRQGFLWAELGGTGDGIIGALAAVGLTAAGDAGRFLELAGGLRTFGESVPARVLRESGITLLSVSRNGELVPSTAVIHTGDWVRPRLIGGRPVLLVERVADGWRCFDRKAEHKDAGE